MNEPLAIDVVTIFPRMLDGFLGESMLRRAVARGAARIRAIDLREFTRDAHRTTDDRPYGGGPGMIMKPEPIVEAVESVRTEAARVVLMTPQGRRFDQAVAAEMAGARHLVFVCGHYEGVDERVRQYFGAEELSVGDFVLTNGVVAAAVVIDAVVRLLPGVLGAGDGAVAEESFSGGLLEYPQYTRPEVYRGMRVPEVLLSGNHERIARWRREQAEQRTMARRPDLMAPSAGSGD
ncbi:MAG: tRNA (guanosine(37)-N1)-methyltransferase TrmD [Lentisphaerae bacterium]|nr:tRNA (guanosine(37)-N1)-methyltransferase TrmD [Lentisphaerota bacterium]